MNTVLITGSTGLLGSSLIRLLDLEEAKVITHAQNGIADFLADLGDKSEVFDLLDYVQPDILINLVGLTNVDLCESEPNSAYLVNTKIVENITDWINESKSPCHLVQISTDQLYDGAGPHIEAEVTLTNFYAFSKYAGELIASKVPSTILRTNFFGFSHCQHRQSFTDWVYHSILNDVNIKVFEDVKFSPLSMKTMAEMIQLIIQRKPIGIFNLGSRNGISKADFAFAFAEEIGLPSNNLQRSTTDKSTILKAYRPKDMRMNCTKFEGTFKLMLPELRDEIKKATKEYHD